MNCTELNWTGLDWTIPCHSNSHISYIFVLPTLVQDGKLGILVYSKLRPSLVRKYLSGNWEISWASIAQLVAPDCSILTCFVVFFFRAVVAPQRRYPVPFAMYLYRFIAASVRVRDEQGQDGAGRHGTESHNFRNDQWYKWNSFASQTPLPSPCCSTQYWCAAVNRASLRAGLLLTFVIIN